MPELYVHLLSVKVSNIMPALQLGSDIAPLLHSNASSHQTTITPSKGQGVGPTVACTPFQVGRDPKLRRSFSA